MPFSYVQSRDKPKSLSAMTLNKNALIRYFAIDNCLRDFSRSWTIDDIVEACRQALLDADCDVSSLSASVVLDDIKVMRSDEFGYNAPVEVCDGLYYRYSIKEYSIASMPLTSADYALFHDAVDSLRLVGRFSEFRGMSDTLCLLQDRLRISRLHSKPALLADGLHDFNGLEFFTRLYGYIVSRQTLCVRYQTASSHSPSELVIYPYLLKEYRNRWFLFGATASQLVVYCLALDNIVGVEPADTVFRDHPGFDPEHFFDDVVGVTKNIRTRTRLVKFWASPEQSRCLISKPVHPSQKVAKRYPDGSHVFTVNVVINPELFSLFLSYGSGVKVLGPDSVVQTMRDKLAEAASLYSRQ